jgi:hypothetical protein
MICIRTFRPVYKRIRNVATWSELKTMTPFQVKEKWDTTIKDVNTLKDRFETEIPGATQITPSWENKITSKFTVDQAKDICKSIVTALNDNSALSTDLAALGAGEYNIENVYTVWKQSWIVLNQHISSMVSPSGFDLRDEKQAKLFKRHLGACVRENDRDEEYIKLRRQIGQILVEKVFGYKFEKYNVTDMEALAYYSLSMTNYTDYMSTLDQNGLSDDEFQTKVMIPAMHISQLVSLKRYDEEHKTNICTINGWLNFALQMDDLYYQTI